MLRRLFDIEHMGLGWDAKLWPIGRLEYHRRYTSGGLLRSVGIYRLGRWQYSFEWWRPR